MKVKSCKKRISYIYCTECSKKIGSVEVFWDKPPVVTFYDTGCRLYPKNSICADCLKTLFGFEVINDQHT